MLSEDFLISAFYDATVEEGLFVSDLKIENCDFDTDVHICSFDSYNSTECFGESGTPLIVNDEGGPILMGLAHSFQKDGCFSEQKTVFTRVASYLDFINSIKV